MSDLPQKVSDADGPCHGTFSPAPRATNGRISKASLVERGWTAAGIARFLDPPDETKTNPRYKCAAPMRLYNLVRVVQVESGAEFQEWSRKSKQRQASAKASTDKRARNLAVEIGSWAPGIKILTPEKLLERSIAHYNDRHALDSCDRSASLGSDPAFLRRIATNYARHVLTNYEALLDRLYGAIGVDEAKRIVRRKVYEAIALAYPQLAAECSEQLLRRQEVETVRP